MDTPVTVTIFAYSTLFVKIFLLLGLIVFSYIKSDTSFINTKPRLFISESILSGLLISGPVAWILHNRGIPWMETISPAIISFLLFYLFHVFMEMSGYNEEVGNKDTSKLFKWATIITMSTLLLISLLIHDFTPGFGTILLETFVIALSGALFEVYKAYNRGHTDYIQKFVKMFGLIASTNLILQFGGVYSKISQNNIIQ
jgi:prepilin signal peptidase PulO-like enzyme (type II secretory pathway)